MHDSMRKNKRETVFAVVVGLTCGTFILTPTLGLLATMLILAVWIWSKS